MDHRLMPVPDAKPRFRKVQAARIPFLIVVLCTTFPSYAQTIQAKPAESARVLNKFIPVLRAMYAAFNRGDFDAAVAPLDPQIEWTEPAEFPGGGTCHGRGAVKGYLKQSRDGWAEGSSEPERFITAGDHIVVFVHAKFRPKDSSQWQEVRLADVYTVRGGKIVQMNAFADRDRALNWAGANT